MNKQVDENEGWKEAIGQLTDMVKALKKENQELRDALVKQVLNS